MAEGDDDKTYSAMGVAKTIWTVSALACFHVTEYSRQFVDLIRLFELWHADRHFRGQFPRDLGANPRNNHSCYCVHPGSQNTW